MNGDVALNGTVPSHRQYLDAAAAAKRVNGVTRVHNHLSVVLPPASYRDSDGMVSASDGTITLTGHVRTGPSMTRPPAPSGLGSASQPSAMTW